MSEFLVHLAGSILHALMHAVSAIGIGVRSKSQRDDAPADAPKSEARR